MFSTILFISDLSLPSIYCTDLFTDILMAMTDCLQQNDDVLQVPLQKNPVNASNWWNQFNKARLFQLTSFLFTHPTWQGYIFNCAPESVSYQHSRGTVKKFCMVFIPGRREVDDTLISILFPLLPETLGFCSAHNWNGACCVQFYKISSTCP